MRTFLRRCWKVQIPERAYTQGYVITIYIGDSSELDAPMVYIIER
jgi:hypothetical protein